MSASKLAPWLTIAAGVATLWWIWRQSRSSWISPANTTGYQDWQ